MRFYTKAFAAAALMAGSTVVPGLAAPALAQSAVPLTQELIEMTWWVTEYRGQSDEVQAPTISIMGNRAEGTTACDTQWQADVHVALPQVRFSNIKAAPTTGCDASGEVQTFLNLLSQVRSARTGVDGLEYLSASNERLMLAVAGG